MSTSQERLLVVVDPADPSGEAGLQDAASVLAAGGDVTVMTFLTKNPAITAFARAEDVSTSEAAYLYLAQVAERLGGTGVDALSSLGTDPAAELMKVLADESFSKVVIPVSVANRLRSAVAEVAARTAVPVTVTPVRRTAA